MKSICLRHFLPLPLVLSALLLLSGCAGVVVGGAGAGALLVHDRRTAGTVIDDQAIALAGEHSLSNAENLTGAHINVSSYNAKVLLTGEVPHDGMRQEAARLIRQDPRVRDVFNELAIAAPTTLLSRSNDVLLASKVKAALLEVELKHFDPTRVSVVTERGIAYLMGLVTRAEANAATDVTRRVGGIQKVVRLFEYVVIEERQPANQATNQEDSSAPASAW